MSQFESILLQGRTARVTGGDGAEMRSDLGLLLQAVRSASVRGLDDERLPPSVAWKVDAGPLTLCIVEFEPALRRMEIVTADSPLPFGPEAKYAPRRLATPYVVLKVPFLRGFVMPRCELFYRHEPLRTLDDALYWSNLLNVSPHSYDCRAWVCTQYLRVEMMQPGILNGLDALARHLWGAASNRSSEEHEGASCFSQAVADRIDPRVTDFNRWEKASIADPRFVLTVPWKPVGLTVRQLIEGDLQFYRVARDLGATSEWVNILMGVACSERPVF